MVQGEFGTQQALKEDTYYYKDHSLPRAQALQACKARSVLNHCKAQPAALLLGWEREASACPADKRDHRVWTRICPLLSLSSSHSSATPLHVDKTRTIPGCGRASGNWETTSLSVSLGRFLQAGGQAIPEKPRKKSGEPGPGRMRNC